MKRNSPKSQASPMPAGGRGNSLELALETSELRYRRLFETAQDGILILDANSGKIIDVNPFLLDLLDYPFESLIGLRLWEIGQFKDVAANQAAFETLQTNEYIRYENLPLRTKTGKQIAVEFVSNVYYVGSDKVIQCNIRDITERAESQSSAKTHATALQLVSRARDEVIAVLSHELRTPLAAISSMVDLLELDRPGQGMLDKKESLALIRRNLQTLVGIISQLLDLSHLTKGALKLELKRLDAHSVLDFARQNLESQRKEREIGIDLRLQARRHWIEADAVKLEQVFSNLIGNALKFTPKGGRVTISTRDEADSVLAIEVSDSGIGIPAEALARIFAPFEQADPSIYQRYGGLGLGLAIARTLIEEHGGTLEAVSQGLDRGSTFTVRFRVNDSLSGRKKVTDEASGAHFPGLRILLVEDHDDTRQCLHTMLEVQGYDVRVAEDAQTALKFNSWHDFDLLLTDVGLPDGSGLELLHKMQETAPDLEGIAMSGYGTPRDVEDSRTAGFRMHLIKPVEFHKLHAAIEKISDETRERRFFKLGA